MKSRQSASKTSEVVIVRVELFGMARLACGVRHVEIEVPPVAGIGELVAALSRACPELVGDVILRDRSGLQESYTFNLNGTRFLNNERLRLSAGDELLLFSSQAGG